MRAEPPANAGREVVLLICVPLVAAAVVAAACFAWRAHSASHLHVNVIF